MLVTVIATIITLLINSMAAFALAKYKFRGQRLMFVMILATLMVPPAVTLVGVFKMITMTGLSEIDLGGDYSRGGNARRGLSAAPVACDHP